MAPSTKPDKFYCFFHRGYSPLAEKSPRNKRPPYICKSCAVKLTKKTGKPDHGKPDKPHRSPERQQVVDQESLKFIKVLER